eukprot:TRINITY_DN44279_c0_g1_i2.p1 TRINITY_DN44279_c0_g1~~TRINITY_DN44279_c0_g1_i2.p1  ORF type:complete len:456 (-),score=51.26 TRINITY_DN44279_c0_g1_i2:41-1408(-)
MAITRVVTIQLAGCFLLGCIFHSVALCGLGTPAPTTPTRQVQTSKTTGTHAKMLAETQKELDKLTEELAETVRRAEKPKRSPRTREVAPIIEPAPVVQQTEPAPDPIEPAPIVQHTEPEPAPVVQPIEPPATAQGGTPRVAIALSFDQKYLDGARVLAHSVHTHMSEKWPIQMVAMLQPRVFADLKFQQTLKSHGYITVEAPLEFDSSKIKTHPIAGDTLRKEIDKSGCCGMSELAKLQALKLVDYEWVLIVDADSLVLKNLDEMFDQPDVDVQYTMDLGLGGGCVNGGFVLLRPSVDHFHKMWATIEDGDWRHPSAWGGTNVGYCYGGPTFQGLIPYFYQHLHQPTVTKQKKIVVLDSCIFNNMGTSKNADGREQGKVPIEEVSVAHFTYCQKPWMCYGHSGAPICAQMHEAWWKTRKDLEKKAGYPVKEQCHGGPDDYPALPAGCANGEKSCE